MRLRLPDLSNRETRTAALLFVYYFLVMGAYAVIKPVRTSLLLDWWGPAWLPAGYIGQPLLSGLAVAASGWLAERVPLHRRVSATTLALLANLLLFRYWFDAAGKGAALAFYIWTGLFTSVLILQFKLIASSQFTPREAKRVMGWVCAGGILGMIVGPVIVYRCVKTLGTENLIYISAGLLALCLPVIRRLENTRSTAELAHPDSKSGHREESGLDLLWEFRQLKLIALILGVSLIAQNLLDFQFNTIVAGVFHAKDDKTAFLAQFFAVLNVGSLVFQLLLTRFILIRFGVGVALFLLPVALVSGSIGILIYPTLLAAALAKLGEGGVRYSVQEAAWEILYMPLPSAVRSKARLFIEVFGNRVFEGMAGLILLCTAYFGVPIGRISLISIAMIGIWMVAVLAVKQEYLQALRSLFSQAPAQGPDRAAEVLDPETVDMLVENLASKDPVQVCQALAMLDIVQDKSALIPHLGRTMANPSLSVRGEGLRLLAHAGAGGFLREAEDLLKASDPTVRVEAVRYLCAFGGRSAREGVARFLKDEDPRVRTAAIASMAGSGAKGKESLRETLDGLLREGTEAPEEVREEIALALGALDDPGLDDLLLRLLRDRSPQVARAALEAVERNARRVFVPMVVPCLADERLQLYAQRTLKAYGDRVLGTLQDYMDDQEEPQILRKAIPGCFAVIGTQGAAKVLCDALEEQQDSLGEAIVEALGEMRTRHPQLVFDVEQVEAALRREVGFPTGVRKPARHLQMAVGLLALIYSTEDVYRANAGLTSGQRDLRANALEFLDNLLKPELKRTILPLIESWATHEERT